ncbi:Ribose import ATP-binding protein RbsA [subsurface metagenome]
MKKIAVRLKNITKQYPGVLALQNVSLEIEEGEVHCLIGENGAGKSTLVKILTGAISKDSGEIWIFGKRIKLKSPREALDIGIRQVYQECKLLENLTVAENIFSGHYPNLRGNPWLVDWKHLYNKAAIMLEKLGIKIDVKLLVENLSPSQKKMVEVAKICSKGAKIIILDEPSGPFQQEELLLLFKIIRQLKKENVSIIYISHRLDEIFEIGDRVSILKDGKYVATVSPKITKKNDIIKLMVGRKVGLNFPPKRQQKEKVDEVLQVLNLNSKDVKNISFSLEKGEILGLAGLIGSGRTEIVRLLFGVDSCNQGKIIINGKTVIISSPKVAIRNGIGFLTEDRKATGLILSHSVLNNISLPILNKIAFLKIISKSKEKYIGSEYVEKLRISTPGLSALVGNLSGGNQQKVVLSKWWATECKILILDEPTIGVDVGTKEEIYKIIRNLSESGVSIIMISSEIPEIIGMADRILVIKEGSIVAELQGENITEEMVIKAAFGGKCVNDK